MANPYLNRRERHSIGKAGRASEKKLAKKLNARQKPASGAMVGAKGDLEVDDFLLEAKSTLNDSFSVRHDQLAKIADEALNAGKTAALTVSFVTGNGAAKRHGEWVLVPLSFWKDRMK